MTYKFLLSTPDKTFYNGMVDSIVCPGPEGYFGILARHARMVAAVGTGVIKVISGLETRLFVVDGGIAEITPESAFILADLAIPATDPADAEEKLQETRALRTIPVLLH